MRRHALLLAAALAACTPGPEPLRGMLIYMADAAVFRPCDGGPPLPVVGGLGARVESAYLEARPGPGEPVLATLVGRIVERSPEPGLPERPHLEIVEFGRFWPDASCETPAPR
jgi:copper homeostasis protein (lipoprotein)